jgi:hypothetical protein
VVPSYTFANAPQPGIIVIPAQGSRSEAQKSWLLANACTSELQQRYPAVHFVNGMRFVEKEKISTAAGLTSGIDLALPCGGAILRTRRRPGYCRLHGVSRSVTAYCGRIPSRPRSRRRQRAGRDLYHRVGRLESPPPPARKRPALDGRALLRLAKLAEAGSQSDTRRSQQLRSKGYAVSSAPCPCRGRRWKRRAQPPGSRHSPPVRCCS